MNPGRLFLFASLTLLLCVVSTRKAEAQTKKTQKRVFTLESAVQFAEKNYPAVRAALERVNAAHAGVSLARTNYLPRADVLWQTNRATDNNITGLLLPQLVVPPISGPVSASPSDGSGWGSTAGLLVSWEAVDFGLRHAQVEEAASAQRLATDEESVTRLDVEVAAAQAFLNLAAAKETVKAAEGNVRRRQVFDMVVRQLAASQLRPGADASRADAELASARIELIQAQEAETSARAEFAELLGVAGGEVHIRSDSLLQLPSAQPLVAPGYRANPLAVAQRARVAQVQAEEHVLGHSYFPHLYLQSAFFGRGSGFNPDGTFAGGTQGLGLDRGNWAVGLTATFPLMDFASLHAQKQIAAANERQQTALYDQTIQELTAQGQEAEAAWRASIAVAQNTPIELTSARETEKQFVARYQAGLGTISDVAESQSLLVRAQTEDALARLGVWRSLLGLWQVQGHLEPFLKILEETPKGAH
jgi:outer membrane protein TolC